MAIDVALSEGKVLLDVDKPIPCALTLEPAEAIDLARKLLLAATAAEPRAKFDPAGCGPGKGRGMAAPAAFVRSAGAACQRFSSDNALVRIIDLDLAAGVGGHATAGSARGAGSANPMRRG